MIYLYMLIIWEVKTLSRGLGVCPHATHLQKRRQRETLTCVFQRHLPLNTLTKLFEGLIEVRLSKFFQLNNTLTPSQRGSRITRQTPAKSPFTRLSPPYNSDSCADLKRCRSFRLFAMEAIANWSWVLREHCAGCHLPSTLTVWTKKFCVARRCLLSKSLLWCRTSIIWSSALVQALSSLSMGRTWSVATELTHHRDPFSPFFRGLFNKYHVIDVGEGSNPVEVFNRSDWRLPWGRLRRISTSSFWSMRAWRTRTRTIQELTSAGAMIFWWSSWFCSFYMSGPNSLCGLMARQWQSQWSSSSCDRCCPHSEIWLLSHRQRHLIQALCSSRLPHMTTLCPGFPQKTFVI